MKHPVWVEVDLDSISYNLEQIRKWTNNSSRVLAIVKADGYGHGAVRVARRLEADGVDFFGVASIEEAAELRESGITSDILVLGVIDPARVNEFIDLGLSVTLFTKGMAMAIQEEAFRRNLKVSVHVKLDTGMGRLGVWHEAAEEFVRGIEGMNNIRLEGIFTHLSSADEDREFTLYQLDIFNGVVASLENLGIGFRYKHAANSSTVIGYSEGHFNMVRPGLALYGLYSDQSFHGKVSLRPAMNFKTRVAWLKRTPKGRSVSYGRTFVTDRDTSLAVLPVGYSHGYPRNLSNKAEVLICDKRAPVVGRICMDQTIVDVGDVGEVSLGDEVLLLGRSNNKAIPAEELANICGTIPYEIVCWINSRVPRVYLMSHASQDEPVEICRL